MRLPVFIGDETMRTNYTTRMALINGAGIQQDRRRSAAADADMGWDSIDGFL